MKLCIRSYPIRVVDYVNLRVTMPDSLTQLRPGFSPKYSRESQGQVERTGLGKKHGIWVRTPPLFSPFLSSTLAVESQSHHYPFPVLIYFSFLPFRTICDGFSGLSRRCSITMHNDASPATEECQRCSIECILRSFHRKGFSSKIQRLSSLERTRHGQFEWTRTKN